MTTDNKDNNHLHDANGSQAAVNLLREKINAIHNGEPDAREEAQDVKEHPRVHSKHQEFMRELTSSNKSLADIQTAWHNYYQGLPDSEKHEVWQEFYKTHNQRSHYARSQPEEPAELELPKSTELQAVHGTFTAPPEHTHSPKRRVAGNIPRPLKTKTVAEIKKQLLPKSSAKRASAKQHFQSLLFGVSLGSVVLLILLFSFFNERFIAPFITPSRQVSATPIIIDSNSAVDPTPKVIIPKINVEIPVVYDEPSIADAPVEKALERGTLHYATTPNPGEKGNVVVFGHSSNNILNNGKYKFAFVLLKRLEVGDTFYLTKDGVRYAYRVYEKKIVKPSEVGVLGATDKPATASLITCDPPGTSLNRLVVLGEQVSPDPAINKGSSAVAATSQPTVIPSNSPSLWQRITGWFH